jgi:hypothetical protein
LQELPNEMLKEELNWKSENGTGESESKDFWKPL